MKREGEKGGAGTVSGWREGKGGGRHGRSHVLNPTGQNGGARKELSDESLEGRGESGKTVRWGTGLQPEDGIKHAFWVGRGVGRGWGVFGTVLEGLGQG